MMILRNCTGKWLCVGKGCVILRSTEELHGSGWKYHQPIIYIMQILLWILNPCAWDIKYVYLLEMARLRTNLFLSIEFGPRYVSGSIP